MAALSSLRSIKGELSEILRLVNAIGDGTSRLPGASGSGRAANGVPAQSLGLANVSTPSAQGSFSARGNAGYASPSQGAPTLPPPAMPGTGTGGGGGGMTAGSAAVRAAGAIGGAVVGMMPETGSMVDMQQALFQASYYAGGPLSRQDFNRLSAMTQARFGNLQTSVGSAQRSAAIVSQFGFNPYGSDGGKMLGQIGTMSLTTGLSNESVAGILGSQSTNPQMTNRLRMIGFEMFDAAGNPRDVSSIANHIVKVVYGASPKPQQIQMGLRPGGALDMMLQSYVPDPGMQQLVKDAMFKQALNKGQYAANDGATAQRLGLMDSNLNPRNAGMRYASSDSRKANSLRDSGVAGYTTGLDAASNLNDAFTELATNVGIVSQALQGLAAVSGFGNGFASTTPGQVALASIGSIPVLGPVLSKVFGSFLHAGGGPISGPGGPKDDKVPALLSNGEFVIQASSVNKYGKGLFEALNAQRLANGGEVTVSGHAALKDGDPHLRTVGVAGGRNITVADWAAPMFQQFLQQWQDDPALGKGRFTLTKGPLDSYEYRQARASKGISDHAGYAVDIRYDVLEADNKRHMTNSEQAAVHRILGGFGGRLKWGGDFERLIDEMHVYVAPGVNGPNDVPADTSTSGSSTSSVQPVSNGLSSMGSSTATMPGFTGTSLSIGISGISGKMASIMSAINPSAPGVTLGVGPNNASTSATAPSSTSSSSSTVATAPPGGNPTYQGVDDGKGPIDLRKIIDNPSNNRAWAKSMAAARGWTGSEWDALDFVWQHESGFKIKDKDPGQGSKMDGNWGTPYTWGIPQSNPGSKMRSAGADWRTNALTQIKWGLDYISERYGKPSKAKAFGMSQGTPGGSNDGYGWYSKGAWQVEKDQLAHIHQNEMILPAPAAEAVRTVMREGKAGQTGGGSASPKGNSVVINLSVARATDDEAHRVAMKVRRILDEDRTMNSIASGMA